MILSRFFLIPLALAIYMQPEMAYGHRKTRSFKERAKPKEAVALVKEKIEDTLPFFLTAPKKWQCIAEKEALPTKVMAIYIGSGKKGFTPSINVATEETEVALGDYINLAKRHHESQIDTTCYNLGSLETTSGNVELLQIDKKTQWGEVRFLQATLIKEKTAYVLTATCLEEEYAEYYPQFLQAFQSFNIKKSHSLSQGDEGKN